MNARHTAWVQQLYREYDAIIYHFGLPTMRAVLEVAPLTRHWGQWDPRTRTITLATKLIEGHGWDVVVEVLKHEMAHQWASSARTRRSPPWRGFRAGLSDARHGAVGGSVHGRLAHDLRRQASTRTYLPRSSVCSTRSKNFSTLATSTNEHEAGLAMQRARQILARYNLERTAAPSQDALTYVVVHRQKRRTSRIESMVVALLGGVFPRARRAHDALR